MAGPGEPRRAAASVLLAVAWVLAGCGSGADEADVDRRVPSEPAVSSSAPAPAPSAAAAPTADASGTAPVRPQEAGRVLDRGLQELLHSGTVDFRFTMRDRGAVLLDTAGRSDLQGGWRSSTSFAEEVTDELSGADGQGPDNADVRLEVRAPDRDVYMQVSGWDGELAGCWLRLDRGHVPAGYLAMAPGVPGYVGVLGELRALGFAPDDTDGSQVAATAPLGSALALLTGQTVQSLGVRPAAVRGARVPVTVYLEDDRVTDVAVEGPALVAAVQQAGGDASGDAAATLAALHLAVRYTPATAGSADVAAPEDALVVTEADLAAERGCRSR